jgi:signal transduction histidine kinase
MTPLLPESEDNEALRALGRASVQVVHDLKNQLNGLKLYAKFLRKRMEKDNRPADELETINKLLAGLDRAATDLSMIVEFGQPLALNKQPGIDLERMVREVAARLTEHPPVTGGLAGGVVVSGSAAQLVGEFDANLLHTALKSISLGALKLQAKGSPEPLAINLQDEKLPTGGVGVIEWAVSDSSDSDPFHSFAGSNGLRLSLAARIIEAHGGTTGRSNGALCVRLPLSP